MIDQIIHEMVHQGWSLTQEALPLEDLQKISQFFDSHKADFNAAKVGQGPDRKRQENIRGDYTYWINPLEAPAGLKNIFLLLDELKIQLNRKLFLGIKEYECHLAYYPAGTFYKRHIDKFEKTSKRVVSFVFYLNQEWEYNLGGELVIYNREGETLKTVFPLPGSLVVFMSEDFPHEVKSALHERRSLTGWMLTDIII